MIEIVNFIARYEYVILGACMGLLISRAMREGDVRDGVIGAAMFVVFACVSIVEMKGVMN